MFDRLIRGSILAACIVTLASPACARQADFDEVGLQMSIMLQNSHFARLPYNAEMSRRFFDDYLEDLDSTKLYFTQEDVDDLRAKYRDRLHVLLLQGKSMAAAKEIYEIFRKRVAERVKAAEELLAGEFDFTGNETVMFTRKKDAKWAKNDEIKKVWESQIKEVVLSEVLRREMIAKLAKEQGKNDPSADDIDPRKKISLRYKRLLAGVEDADDEDIANYFLSAVSRSYDPHTDYLSFREMSRFKDDMKNELIGIGALLQAEEDGATAIKGIVIGGPADKEGSLKLNDRVVAVDSRNSGTAEGMTDIMFMPIEKVVDLIRGKEGSSVALKVEPAGGRPGETEIIVIVREKVEMKDEQASGELIEIKGESGKTRRLGVITLPSFYADFDQNLTRCSVDVEKILIRLMEEKMDGLLFDLRNNGGGSLEEVRRMTGFFIPKGPVVQVKNTLGQVQVKNSEDDKPIYTGPMVVLTDKSSASASEILAGALQDYNRAVIVGSSSTYGKGTVQQPMDIGNEMPLFAARDKAGFLKVTIQKFYRPSGSSTQKEGVVPHIVLPNMTDALEFGEAFMDNVLPHERIRPAADFEPADENLLFLPRLKELSRERVAECKDFKYVIEDVLKVKEQLKENRVSLNKAEREKELAESDALNKERNAERRERFAKIQEKDAKKFIFYRLTLEDVAKAEELKAYDPTVENGNTMRKAVDETEGLDDTPKWPSALNLEKREAIHVLADLIQLTESAKVAGVIKSDGTLR